MRKFTQNIADYIRETDKILLLLSLIASLFGCALVFSATHMNGSRTFLVQLIAVFIGISVAIFISLFDYTKMTKHYIVYIVSIIVLLLFTYEFGYAPEGTENRAWIELPFGMSFQSSEIVKILMILIFAKHVSSIKKEDINKFSNVVLLVLDAVAAPALVMGLQQDLGTVTVMLFVSLSMLFVAGIKLRYFALAGVFIIALSPIVWFFGLSQYQKDRFSIILDLESDAENLGYQQLHGLKALGSGGLFGQGFLQGASTQSQDVPKAYNDFILTVAGEELGLVGCVLVFAIIIAILIRIIYIGAHSRDTEGKIICSGVFGIFAAQLMINAGMVLSLLPVIGVTLPFFSAGGTSLVALYVSVGLVTSVHKNKHVRSITLRDRA